MTTFISNIETNLKNLIEVEIGDIKEPLVFMPQVKVKRWNNEVNFSIRLKDEDDINFIQLEESTSRLLKEDNVSLSLSAESASLGSPGISISDYIQI